MCIVTNLSKIVEELSAQKLEAGAPVDLGELSDNLEPAQEPDDFTAEDIAAEYALNAPCDTYGMCAGSSCPYFFKCQGK